ncbi:flagellar hook-associated protein FlgK [Silvibacterium sp.]|uniref:flagellar hook-associated protein FlgK n=1 Tax=Silvibacterium sp. TaxID=1964179 RepID=UPI0039E34E82
MATLNTAFNITTGALDADQAALAVVSNNVSNANTTGYTREVATFEENDPITIGNTQWGDGVTMIGGIAQRDPVLEEELQQQNQAASASDSRMTELEQIQTIFDQTTTSSTSSTSSTSGISQDMTSFFDALSSLESDPSSTSLRQSVLSSADTLASDFQSASSQLTAQQSDIDQESVSIVQQVNSLSQSIAQLNGQIESVSSSTDTSTLEDQRTQDVQQLSQLIGIHQIQDDSNGLTITTSSGAVLVAEGSSYALSTGSVDGTTHIFDSQGNDITTSLASGGGQIGGLLEVRDQDIPQISSALDTLAYDFGSAVNSANEAGYDLNGNAGTAMFTLPTSSTGAAAEISVAITDPSLIAAAGSGEGTSGDSNLVSMAAIANQTIVDGSTPTDYYSSFVSTIGTMVSDATTDNSAQQASLSQLQTQVDSLSSVNLNDEAASLETFEQSYQAASKVFSTLDTVMLAALNLGEQVAYSS